MLTAQTILLVEDDPNDQLLFIRASKKAGLTQPVFTATDGRQAINFLTGAGDFTDREKYPVPALVVLDLKLPLATGFEVLAVLRNHPETQQLPVVMLTSSENQRDIEQAYALGANGYLVKPPSNELLTALVVSLKNFLADPHTYPLTRPDLHGSATRIA
ncbi:response regulator [Oleiharenicola lentus]|uniref:response regulator n=1 Tax=Oleiharenicola lentus TaxID=2508720 RepID=UPI003F6612FC